MRISIAIIGFLGIALAPWWIPALCMILLSLRWAALEAVLIGVFMDLIWQGSGMLTSTSWHTWPLFTLFGIALLWGFEPLRRRFLF